MNEFKFDCGILSAAACFSTDDVPFFVFCLALTIGEQISGINSTELDGHSDVDHICKPRCRHHIVKGQHHLDFGTPDTHELESAICDCVIPCYRTANLWIVDQLW